MMIFQGLAAEPGELRLAIEAARYADEDKVAASLLTQSAVNDGARARIDEAARELVEVVRRHRKISGGIDVFLQQYDLSTEEGIILMCVAESLLRIPDAETADELIRDKIGSGKWEKHVGGSESLLVNASTWALMLTGRVIDVGQESPVDLGDILGQMAAKSGEPLIRAAMRHAMNIMGRQFVFGKTIGDALARSHEKAYRRYRFSYDMLGEGARTASDAERYFRSYLDAVAAIGADHPATGLRHAPAVSIKLSALHPRYEMVQRGRILDELTPRLIEIAVAAKSAGIGITFDAEEADRLELSLDLFEAVARSPLLAGWEGLGLAVQAYQKRALPVLDWLSWLSAQTDRRIMVRLVKGAYWDSEIKRAQEGGFVDYPVFTRKAATDVSYIACARRLLAEPGAFYPQFATHNAQTVAVIDELSGAYRDFEFQRLHGMGQPLHEFLLDREAPLAAQVRIYAPVGGYKDLLAYLVRRLLENGANTSFVNRLADDQLPVDKIIADPAARLTGHRPYRNSHIALPRDIYPDRPNSAGFDLSDTDELRRLARALPEFGPWEVVSAAEAGSASSEAEAVTNPANHADVVGWAVDMTPEVLDVRLAAAGTAAAVWDAAGGDTRAACLDRAADIIERRRDEFYALCIREAGKCLDDAIAEVREAVDFCRYYAARTRDQFGVPKSLRGPTGESNSLGLRGRGIFTCISPWNFPLAIFTGQVAAALAAGNAVMAKPAEQTPLIAGLAVRCLHEAGIPTDVLNLVPGPGKDIGEALINDSRVAGVAFTGSVETARRINQMLARREGPIVPLIAETGGMNAMIVDSSALPEQVVDDAITSAFRSAGQRCSALRVLYLQDDVAGQITEMLAGKAAELKIGDPALVSTDIGPVIDGAALRRLQDHAARMDREGECLFRGTLDDNTGAGTFFAPCIYAINGIDQLTEEVFGPILHIVTYASDELDQVVRSINDTGFGLTLGIHSRIEQRVQSLAGKLRVGNIYVNRNMIGAVVGVQPFGGEGLSGTGPKAGGPNYLTRFAVERTLTINTAAVGGNVQLMSDDDG